MKKYSSPGYNYIFDEKTGFFARWGNTVSEDPDMSPIGPEIADVSVSSICHQSCKFCYQSNLPNGKNMSLETFKIVVDKMPSVLQIALATGDVDANPDIWNMMEYARSKGIVPNITINGYRLTDEIVSNLVKYTGAVAVSLYSEDVCFNAVKRLTDAGQKQVNIHQLLSAETTTSCFSVLEKYKTDDRLKKLNAIVFLSLKQKGRGENYHTVSKEDYQKLVDYAMENNIPIGFDSCGSLRFLNAISSREDYSEIIKLVEPCEASCFSSFVNVDGMYFPCSFLDGVFEGISVVDCKDFLQDVWFNPRVVEWRDKLIVGCRNCPVYKI
jgi:MoaA/NifB/PqqE/SkfB family radical SAM enzyme